MLISELKKDFPQMKILLNEPLKNYTYTKTGGPADALIFPSETNEVQAIVLYCEQQQIPWTVLGNASNLIVRDGGIRGVVLMLTDLTACEIEGDFLTVQAGARLIDTTYQALDASLTGMEFACGIPGSIGGAVYMNAGAYGGEIKDIFSTCEFLQEDGTVITLNREAMAFSYRHSTVQDTKGVVLSATFQLQPGEKKAINERMKELTFLRESKQPLEYPSCGSVFKRPVGHFTGKLIQDAGLQGLKWGGAQISEKHAGFIVNIDHATATDYIELIAHIQEVIFDQFAVRLETEVRIIGEERP